MVRQASGVYLRSDRLRVAPSTSVRVVSADRKHSQRAELLELLPLELTLRGARSSGLALGAAALVVVTLPERYLEVELPCVVAWEDGDTFGLRFEYLTARQSYGLALWRSLLQGDAEPASRRFATP
jgi:hypothetical protein